MKKEYICIACPVGCHLDVTFENNNIKEIEGNKCKRGIDYAVNEFQDPKRMVTVTCKVHSELIHRIPVKTTEAISKKHIEALIQELYALELTPPLHVGDLVLKNYKETGIDVVITRNLKR